MRMGFDLSSLIRRYLYSLAPLTEVTEFVEGTNWKVVKMAPIQFRYQRLMKLLDDDSERTRKYKSELFGSATPVVTPDLYQMISLGQKLVGNYMIFLHIPIHERAQMIAYYLLNNMVEVVQRHDDLQQKKRDKIANKKK